MAYSSSELYENLNLKEQIVSYLFYLVSYRKSLPRCPHLDTIHSNFRSIYYTYKMHPEKNDTFTQAFTKYLLIFLCLLTPCENIFENLLYIIKQIARRISKQASVVTGTRRDNNCRTICIIGKKTGYTGTRKVNACRTTSTIGKVIFFVKLCEKLFIILYY